MKLDPTAARLLVVDDDPGMLRAVSRVLGRGHQVTCVANGNDAIEAAAATRPEVAIVDVWLPDLNGFEVSRSIRSARPETDIILMTGDAEDPDEMLIRAVEEGAFYFIQKPFDRRVLLALVSRCLELRRLREEKQRTLKRMARELQQARDFQRGLLPPTNLQLDRVTIQARYRACQELAGDFYDYATIDRGIVALIVADVVGHGASAAMMTSLVKSSFQASRSDWFEPSAVVARVRESISTFDESKFLTLVAARLEFGSKVAMTYACAGHPQPILHRTGESPTLLPPTGPLLSPALAEIPCDQASVDLEVGDRLLFYTDGIIEARSGTGTGHFGEDRLAALVAQSNLDGDQLLNSILDAVSDYSGLGDRCEDDMTLLITSIK